MINYDNLRAKACYRIIIYVHLKCILGNGHAYTVLQLTRQKFA